MEIVKHRRLSDIVRGLYLLCHPLPVLFHTIGVTLFALIAAWPVFVWSKIALVIGAHLAMQLSIAILNDYCDRNVDAAAHKKKPIPLGLVHPSEALIIGIVCVVLMLLLLLPLPPLALLISLLYLVLGQGYNLGLKATPLSGVVFALAIPLIPVYAFVGVGHSTPLLFWLVPVAALLGVALNLANSLPDIEDDTASRVRTLAVLLGVKRSLFVSTLLVFLALALVTILSVTHTVPALPAIIIPTLILTACLACSFAFFSAFYSAVRGRKTYFYLVVLTSLLLAGGWIIGAIF